MAGAVSTGALSFFLAAHGWFDRRQPTYRTDGSVSRNQKRSDELHKWLSDRKRMFRELDDAIQIEAANVLAQFPRLVGEKKLRTSADSFVIALARVANLQLVTEEKPIGNLQRPNIPDVCGAL